MSVVFADGLKFVLLRDIKSLSLNCHLQDPYLHCLKTVCRDCYQASCCQGSKGLRLKIKLAYAPCGADGKRHFRIERRVLLILRHRHMILRQKSHCSLIKCRTKNKLPLLPYKCITVIIDENQTCRRDERAHHLNFIKQF